MYTVLKLGTNSKCQHLFTILWTSINLQINKCGFKNRQKFIKQVQKQVILQIWTNSNVHNCSQESKYSHKIKLIMRTLFIMFIKFVQQSKHVQKWSQIQD